MRIVRAALPTPMLRAAALVWAVAWGPLLLYIAYEALTPASGGNPIGLGLLAFFGTPVALVVTGIAVADLVRRERRRDPT